jgi:hypothetical protein
MIGPDEARCPIPDGVHPAGGRPRDEGRRREDGHRHVSQIAPAMAPAGTSPCKRANRKLDSVPEHRADACQAIKRERRSHVCPFSAGASRWGKGLFGF